MLKFAYAVGLLFIITVKPMATGKPGEDLNSITQEIYQQTGLSDGQVPFRHFEAAYHRYLQGKQSGEFKRPLISFVNFDIPSGEERYFLVDVAYGSARVLHSTFVSHGKNSGSHKTATSFGNVNNSLKSSLGFFKVAEPYSGKHGSSLRLDGLSGSLNSRARSRAIVMHSGDYVSSSYASRNGYVGRSWGCFVVPYSIRDSLFESIRSGSLLYSFYRDQGANPNGSTAGLEDVALGDTQGSNANIVAGEGPTSLSDDPRFANASRSLASKGQAGNHMSLAPGVGVDGPSSLDYDGDGEPDNFEEDNPQVNSSGDTPYKGNEDFESCQSYADRPWNQVVEGTQNGEDPHKYFQGSWLDLEEASVNGDNISYGPKADAAKHHLGVVNDCAAMATVGDSQNFMRENPNEVAEVRSQDGSIVCNYQGPEAVDFTQCQEMIKAHDALMVAEADLHKTQGEDFKKAGESSLQGLQTGINIQGNSAIVAQNLADNAAKNAAAREEFQSARLGAMAGQLAAMPNYKSLLETCESKMAKFPQGALADYQAYIKTIPDIKIDPRPPLGNSCQRALGRLNVKYIQNKKAKDQAKAVLEKLGYKIEELQNQQGELNRQKQGFKDAGMKGPSIPDYKLKELKQAEVGAHGVIDLDLENKFKPSPIGPSRNVASKSNFSYPSFDSSKSTRRRGDGVNQGLINPNQKDHAQILKENTRTFIQLLKEGDPKKLLSFMKENGLTLEDIDFAAKRGIITKELAEQLKESLKGRLGKVTKRRMVDFDPNGANSNGNSEWQIEKNKDKSLFDIISNRYLKQEHLSR